MIPFADAHVHLNDVDAQLQMMDRFGISQAVVFWGRDSDNETILRAAGAHPDRFIPFASVSPERRAYREYWQRDDVALLPVLEALLGAGGFRGIGEISITHFPGAGFPEADFSPESAVMRGIMELAGRYGVPVMVHCEVTRIQELSALLRAFPDVPVVWAHGGYTPYVLAQRMLERHSNLYYDLTARTWASHPRSPDYTIFKNDTEVWPEWLALIESHADRMLVGTDATQRSETGEASKISRVMLLLAQLDETTRQKVAVTNLLALVGG